LAIEDGETLYTFKELDDLSSKFAEVIRDTLQSCRNLNPDQDVVIGVCIPPSDKLILSLFAILKLGAAYLPFDVSFPDERVVKMVKV
jgi:surfactin family lipopeptide synthetase A